MKKKQLTYRQGNTRFATLRRARFWRSQYDLIGFQKNLMPQGYLPL